MPSPTGTYNDLGSGIPWDSFVATINSKAFILEDFTPDEGSSTQVSNNEALVPRAARHTRTLITATCTAQYPSGAALADTPALFATFTTAYRGGSAKTWIITKVGIPQKAGMETKVALTVAEQLNSGDS